MLLHRPSGTGSVGRRALAQRVDDFAKGLWTDLIQRACNTVPRPRSATPVRSAVEEQERRRRADQSRVQRGQMSRARQELTGAKLAPRDESTLEKLKRKRPQERLQEISAEIIDFIPDRELNHDTKRFAECLRSAPSGSSPGPGGCSNEFLRVCLDDGETLLLLTRAAEDFARATVPDQIFRALMTATMTALEKRDGGVPASPQALCSDDWSPRLLARQFGKEVETTCSPFQFAHSTRARVDCVGHVVQVLTDANPNSTVFSVDGIGAFDHVYRVNDVQIVRSPRVASVVAVRQSIVRVTIAVHLGVRQRHLIQQQERGEQSDPLMPLLFSLAIHNALAEVKAQMVEGECLFAFLDNVYVVAQPARIRVLYNLLGAKLMEGAGIQLHESKTRTWNRGGLCPDEMQQLVPAVWSPCSIKILGAPVESLESVARATGRGGEVVERNPMSARSAMRVANPRPMRWTSLSPFLADHAAESVRKICPRPRRRHDVHHARAVGRTHQF